MGQKQSSKTEDVESEIEFLAKETGMAEDDLRDLYEKFSAKKRICKKDFIGGFRQFYPK